MIRNGAAKTRCRNTTHETTDTGRHAWHSSREIACSSYAALPHSSPAVPGFSSSTAPGRQSLPGNRSTWCANRATASTVTTIDANGEEGQNVVRIANGTVDVVSATCSNQICVDHDPISQAGEEIVCLPHGVVIDVVEDETDAPALIS